IQASNASGGTFDAGNYTLTYVDADLSVTPRAATITADAQSKVYGDTLALGTNAFTASNLANGETVGSVTLTSLGGHDADTTSAVGTYTGDIQASNASGGTFDAGNYTLTYVDGDLSVTPRDLTIAADAQSKVYGDTLALGTSAFTVSNLANDETVESVTLTSLGGHDADTTTPVGTYMSDIQVSDASGGTFDPANYTLTYVDGDLTVNPRTLVINVDAKAKAYRREDPLLTFQVAEGNLANDDRFVGELTREVGELPGLYRIDQGSLRVNENYDYVFNPNYLEVVATPELEFLSQLISLVNDSIVGVWTLPDVGELPRQSLPGDDPRIGLFDALLQAVQGGKLNGGSNEQTRLMCP
ncbi:MAG: hypothetical protein CMI01_13290, partial [Oceanospirillaceae bacterium]|nr:hypothetical protein [Oceanospirillaceae bacterium]